MPQILRCIKAQSWNDSAISVYSLCILWSRSSTSTVSLKLIWDLEKTQWNTAFPKMQSNFDVKKKKKEEEGKSKGVTESFEMHKETKKPRCGYIKGYLMCKGRKLAVMEGCL